MPAVPPLRIAGLPREITHGRGRPPAVGPARPLLGAAVSAILLGAAPAVFVLWLWGTGFTPVCYEPCGDEHRLVAGLFWPVTVSTVLLIPAAPFVGSRVSGFRAMGIPAVAVLAQMPAIVPGVSVGSWLAGGVGALVGLLVAEGVVSALTIRPPEASHAARVVAGRIVAVAMAAVVAGVLAAAAPGWWLLGILGVPPLAVLAHDAILLGRRRWS